MCEGICEGHLENGVPVGNVETMHERNGLKFREDQMVIRVDRLTSII